MLMNNQKTLAIRAAQKALSNLYNAKEELEKARGWGIYDILGGGFLSSGIKHNRIHQAQQYIHQAQNAAMGFSLEFSQKLGLNDIIEIRSDGLEGVLDIFADNVFSDVSVQSKIKKALVQVNESIDRTEYLLNGLSY